MKKYLSIIVFIILCCWVIGYAEVKYESSVEIGIINNIIIERAEKNKIKSVKIVIQSEPGKGKSMLVTPDTCHVIEDIKGWDIHRLLKRGDWLLVEHDGKENPNVIKIWPIIKHEDPKHVSNFVYFEERDLEKKIKNFQLGEYYNKIYFHKKRQLIFRVNSDYFRTQKDLEKKKIILVTEFTTNEGKVKTVMPNLEIKGNDLLRGIFRVYPMDQIGIKEHDQIILKVEYCEKTECKWEKRSEKELTVVSEKSGFHFHPTASLVFVRNSFREYWEPRSGAAFTVGLRFPTGMRTSFWSKAATVWNKIDLQFGINAVLVDFDADRSEIGMGYVFSIFDNTFYIGSGTNYSTSRKKNKYAMFGINLTNIYKLIEGLVKK